MAKFPTLRPALRSIDMRTAKPPRGDAEARSAKPTLDFYGSAAWKAIRAVVQREAKRTCEACGKTDTRIYVDHRIEMRDGGAPLERSNLQALCGVCHARKSAREREKRAGREAVTGNGSGRGGANAAVPRVEGERQGCISARTAERSKVCAPIPGRPEKVSAGAARPASAPASRLGVAPLAPWLEAARLSASKVRG